MKKTRTAWNKGLKMSPEWGEARKHSFAGRKHTEETKAKISRANKGHIVSPEMREKMSIIAKERLASLRRK